MKADQLQMLSFLPAYFVLTWDEHPTWQQAAVTMFRGITVS